jgi:RNA polymerase sigma-70 factor, ECF subfamily
MKKTRETFLDMLSDYQGILHKVSLAYFRNETDREDNIQEIIYQLWKSYPRLKKRQSTGSWIYAISINTSLSRLKNRTRVEYRETVPELPEERNAFENISKQESLDLLLDAIHRLNEIDRSIMLLYLDEMKYDEIAAITGISKSNVGVRINRAKAFLKQHLNRNDHEK